VDPQQRTGVRFTVDVGPGDAGVRISLRMTEPEGGFRDVLGVLLSWDDLVRVEKRDGTVEEIEPSRVVAAKRIPPPPERRR
jgi:hypothetical protein